MASSAQPPATLAWNRIDASSRAGDDHESLSIGWPLGWPHENGWIPIESLCQTSA